MKLRIKGNSLRLRLTKTEVEKLSVIGCIEERISFGLNYLVYSVRKTENDEVSAMLNGNIITVFIPSAFADVWPTNDVITIEGKMILNENESLFLKIEKDFKCIESTNEDQSDNYENPTLSC